MLFFDDMLKTNFTEKIGKFKSTLDTLETLLTHRLRQEVSSLECNSDKINIETEKYFTV